MKNKPSPERATREPVIANIASLRRAMAGLWGDIIPREQMREKLDRLVREHQAELVAAGHEYHALRHLTEDRMADSAARPVHSPNRIVLASGSGRKRDAVRNAIRGLPVELIEFSSPQKSAASEAEAQASGRERMRQIAVGEFSPYIPGHGIVTVNTYALWVAKGKVRDAERLHPGNAILAGDVVVAHDDNVLEKINRTFEAVEILRRLSGEKIKISFAISLLAAAFRRDILFNKSGNVAIQLKKLSEDDIWQYLGANPKYQDVSGVIDYNHPASLNLMEKGVPAVLERTNEDAPAEGVGVVRFDPALLQEAGDLTIGFPNELVVKMIRQALEIAE